MMTRVWKSTIEISQKYIVNDYVSHSAVEVSKDVDVENQDNVELPFDSQVIFFLNMVFKQHNFALLLLTASTGG